MSATPLKKTNVMRLLDVGGVPYRFYEYETADGKIDAVSVAAKLGKEPEQVFKTLVTQSDKNDHFVFVVPSVCELNLKLAAKAAKQKNIALIPLKQLLPLTGYMHGGCSPIGMKKPFPTFIDETALLYDEIFVSAGKIGVNICVNPQQLADFISAEITALF